MMLIVLLIASLASFLIWLASQLVVAAVLLGRLRMSATEVGRAVFGGSMIWS